MTVRLLTGDCRQRLRDLTDGSVNCCVTSPPYFGLRDYGASGQVGLEETPDAYVDELVAIFREVRRVLRDDGTIWLNIGDSYNAAGRTGHGTRVGFKQGTNRASAAGADHCRPSVDGLKPKDLIGIPWMLAFALRADGWYLRSHIVWHKPNPMPESVTDRPTSAHESLFLLSKSEHYYYDADAIREPCSVDDWDNGTRVFGGVNKAGANLLHGDRTTGRIATPRKVGARDNFRRDGSKRESPIYGQSVGTHRPDRPDTVPNPIGRNKRNVWTVATRPFAEAHFATFPPDLIEPCILAGCQYGGTVIDPFGGAGTTGLVADRHGRNAILCEINPDYVAMAERRIRADGGMLTTVEIDA